MATITVPSSGATVSNVTLNDTLQAASGVNLSGPVIYYEVDGNSILQSLYIGYDIEVDIGFLASGMLTGTGTITGPTNAAGGNLPLLRNFGTLDINGAVTTSFSNDGQLTVSSGEALDLRGDLLSFGTVSVAPSGELDLDNPSSAFISQIDVEGRLKSATGSATLQAITDNGTIDITTGTLALTNTLVGTGSILVESGAKLDISAATTVSGTIVLNSGSTIKVSQSTVFTGTLQTTAAGATIDLINLAATGANVLNGQIAITTSAGTINLNETGLATGQALSVMSDGVGGSLIALPGPTAMGTAPGQSTTLPVYRFFDNVHGTHFFTADNNERDVTVALSSTYTEETNGFGAVTQSDPNATAVYRFFDTKFGTHFFTANAGERDSVIAARPDLTFEPSSTFYEHSTQQAGDVAIYRLFDKNFGTHFYTGDQNEYNGITTPGTSSYRADLTPEGTGFYAPSGSFL